jgi:hypothetical protein
MVPTRRDAFIRRLTVSATLLTLTFLLLTTVRDIPVFTQNVYLPFSRTVSGWLGVLFSFTTYAAAEVLLVMAAAAAVFCLFRSIIRSVRERTVWPLAIWGAGAVQVAVGTVFIFILLWGGTYYSEKLETRLDLTAGQKNEEILYETALRHLEDVIRYTALVPRNESGEVDAGGFDALAPEAARAMRSLMDANPGVFGKAVVAPPKRFLFTPIYGMLGISGIYSPFTGEAIVNTVNTDPFLPSVMTHELAHRLGFAAEEDANFIAYLACMASGQTIFRYSGALMAYTYCFNAITDPVYKHNLWMQHLVEAEESMEDVRRNREGWDEYDGPLREVSEAVNDAYLQTMGQEEGVKSYGRVVDLLIALYISEEHDKTLR